MMNNVKSFAVGYNPINENNVFCPGDVISGQVTLDLSKNTDVRALSVEMRGKAEVRFESTESRKVYISKEEYFREKKFLIEEGRGNNRVSKGSSVYPFTFQIPDQDLPPSFRGKHGKIVYKLEANLRRSKRTDSKAKAEFKLLSKSDGAMDPNLEQIPRHLTTELKLKCFKSGFVAMDVNIDKFRFHPGEGIKVVVSIQNKSSRDVRPKYCLTQESCFLVEGKFKLHKKYLVKEVGDAIPPSAGQTVTKVITVPTPPCPNIFNCHNIRVMCFLWVILDNMNCVFGRRITFPIIILPVTQSVDETVPPVSPAYGFGHFPTE